MCNINKSRVAVSHFAGSGHMCVLDNHEILTNCYKWFSVSVFRVSVNTCVGSFAETMHYHHV